jgi:hypothetical protein
MPRAAIPSYWLALPAPTFARAITTCGPLSLVQRLTTSMPGMKAIARKLGVSFFAYVQDRIAETNHLPALDQVIQARAQDLNLGMSWNTS